MQNCKNIEGSYACSKKELVSDEVYVEKCKYNRRSGKGFGWTKKNKKKLRQKRDRIPFKGVDHSKKVCPNFI